MMPPLMIWLHIERPDHPSLRIWLPLFLVWLLLLPLTVLALVCTALADVVLFLTGQRYHHFTFLLLGALGLLADMRGTVVKVNGPQTIVDMTIW